MIETLLGGLLGGVFRLAPEVLKWADRKGERAHELALQDKALEFEKLRGAQRMAEIGSAAEALSISVRPVITYWFMALYCAVKVAGFVAAVNGGASWLSALLHTWTEADQALWAGVLNFWFLGRVFDRARP